jgi:hypothetical protein
MARMINICPNKEHKGLKAISLLGGGLLNNSGYASVLETIKY